VWQQTCRTGVPLPRSAQIAFFHVFSLEKLDWAHQGILTSLLSFPRVSVLAQWRAGIGLSWRARAGLHLGEEI
jgi:hypothetical protein